MRDQRGRENRQDPGQEADLREESDDILRGDPYGEGGDRAASSGSMGAMGSGSTGAGASASMGAASSGSMPAVGRGSQPTVGGGGEGDEDERPSESGVVWGSDDGAPAPEIKLASDLPPEPPADDPDPTTYHLVDGPGSQLGDDVASVVGVRFVPAGRIQWCDAGDSDFVPGERVLVDSDRGQRLAWIATVPTRRGVRDRNLRRVIRRANEIDLRGELAGEHDRKELLRVAKDAAANLKLPLKVFRVEKTGGKQNVYYSSDERLDFRDFVRDVGQATGLRLELRQLGVRDEAKMVGGIGSCGLTLCCTTWLPDFVPVSIKMAKDQGLVLSPTKVSGQCGRLKCCLVYEQAGYAEMRKGLPKLGKRVIAPRGEGRVVEVDVLRQRIRVSYGPGDTEVLPASEVKPMFPSGNQPRQQAHEPDDEGPESDEPDLPTS
jgi:cell fate regulator YaaT (PSP1 superfamily)